MAIEKALLSVSDKTGLVEFAQRLHDLGIELLSTGGSAKALREADLPVTDVADYTDSPELFGGRVKTLHPRVHGGILHRRDVPCDVKDAKKHDVPAIDLVVVNLYPFEETVAQEGVTLSEAIEKIDVGGPTMIRAAAKNYDSVTVVVDPEDYQAVADELEASDATETDRPTRERLAIKAFQRTAAYDQAISTYLNEEQSTKKTFSLQLPLAMELRLRREPPPGGRALRELRRLLHQASGQGVLLHQRPRHPGPPPGSSPSSRAPPSPSSSTRIPAGSGAPRRASGTPGTRPSPPTSRRPSAVSIICNRPLDAGLARVICEIFTDIIIAPDFEADARALLQKKKKRIVQMHEVFKESALADPVLRSAPGGLLVMDSDPRVKGLGKLEEKVVTERPAQRGRAQGHAFSG